MGAFCLCRARTRQQNAPIYNRAVLSFDDLFALFGIPVSTHAHPRAPARSRRVAHSQRVAPHRAAPRRVAAHAALRRVTSRLAASRQPARAAAQTQIRRARAQTRWRAERDRNTCADTQTRREARARIQTEFRVLHVACRASCCVSRDLRRALHVVWRAASSSMSSPFHELQWGGGGGSLNPATGGANFSRKEPEPPMGPSVTRASPP